MKKNSSKKCNSLRAISIVLLAPLLLSWGGFGHEHINRSAVFALPGSLQQFFYNHIDFITLESTIPDLRKYTLNDKAENPRHYIDLENFGQPDTLPANLADLKKKYEEKILQKNGILPWYIQDMMEKLTKAFKEKRKTEILFIAADLGHYLGDAHMPLHTSDNHDGQLTNQKGIHAFWEAHLPELFGNGYNYYTGPAVYINDISKETWRIITSSNQLADTLLLADRQLKEQFPADNIYKKDNAGNIIKSKWNIPVHTLEYSKQYHDKLNGMVEKQMRLAITATANFWYTAWVNAGSPNLSDLDPETLTKNNRKALKKELNLWKKGKLYGLESEKEF